MPFVAKHVRLTNSGKIPELFLVSKVQGPSELADAKLGKLYFVLQINLPWNHAASIGASIINMISREYYRQEATTPLENFERAVAKANRLIEQLVRDGETALVESIHALIGLAVGDEFHLASTGGAEAYFLRDGKINLITDPATGNNQSPQAFSNLITGELSADDLILLGSPGLYGALTTDELEMLLKQPLADASLAIARRLKSLKQRKLNAIIIQFSTLQATENSDAGLAQDTIYLDQPLDSTWQIVKYYFLFIGRPALKGTIWLGQRLAEGSRIIASACVSVWRSDIKPFLSKLFQQLANRLGKTQLPKITLPNLPILAMRHANEPNIPVHHYTAHHPSRFQLKTNWARYLFLPFNLLQVIGRQLGGAARRSPRLWYIIIALLLLSSIGASIQTHKTKTKNHPVATAATVDEIKTLINDAKQAKVYGNLVKARELYSQAIAKAELVKDSPKLANQTSSLVGAAQKELTALAGATELSSPNPLLTLQAPINVGVIFEGAFYYVTADGQLQRQLLTGGDPTTLGQLSSSGAANQLRFDSDQSRLFIQAYNGTVFSYDLTTKKLTTANLADGTFPVSTGLDNFGDNLYLLDPAANQIWRYAPDKELFAKAASYLKTKKISLTDGIDLAIDGSVFVLHKTGEVTKYTKGSQVDWKLTNLPAPFDLVPNPVRFFASPTADTYYLADTGNETIPPRVIELDKTGKFVHQYFLPRKWRGSIKLVMANPKNHKVWVVVNKELYEFTLVQ